MKILFVNPYYRPYLGGVERIVEQVGTHLVRQPGVEAVGVLTTRAFFPDRWMHHLPRYEKLDGMDVFRCTFTPSTVPRVFHAALSGYVSLDAIRVLRSFKPDVIHYTYGEWWAANLWIYLASPATTHVLSTIFHDVPHMRSTAPLYAVNRWLVPRMQAVHVLSEVERRQVHRAYRAALERTVVIPPGVDLPDGVPHRRGRDSITILAVGRLNSHKGQLRLVNMVQQILRHHPELQLRLWLVGDDAGDGPAIARFVAENGLDSLVHIFGHCTDQQLHDLYQQADVFALPTQFESFGIVFLEAMSHGLPVVTYGVGPVPSVLTQGALLVPPDDEQGFIEALTHLAQDPEARERIGCAARELTASSFSWGAVSERFFELYSRAIRLAHSPDR